MVSTYGKVAAPEDGHAMFWPRNITSDRNYQSQTGSFKKWVVNPLPHASAYSLSLGIIVFPQMNRM